ncbi:MAG: MFS transporter, partial [Myxococcota bacterium]|nr:MFS transporter [Myxococcota bacterium]
KPFFIAKPALGESLGWDATMLGWVGSSYLVAYMLGQFVAGWLGNRVGARLLVLAGMGVSLVVNLAFGWTNSWATFMALMAVNGLAQATGWAGNVGTMAPWFQREERGTVMGLWATNYQVGGVAANTLTAWVLGQWGYQWSFAAGSVVLLVVWGVFLLNQANRPEDVGLSPIEEDSAEVESRSDVEGGQGGWTRQVVINVLLVGCFYFFVKFIRYALWSWAPYLLYHSYGLELDQAGYLSTVFDLAGIAGVIVAGFLSDRLFGGRRVGVSMIFIVGMAVACGLLYTLGPTSLVLFGVSLGLVGFTLYGPDALMTGAGAIEAGPRGGATLSAGIINGMGSVGSVAQEFLLGSLLGQGEVAQVFGVLLGSAVLAAVCLGVLYLRTLRGQANL